MLIIIFTVLLILSFIILFMGMQFDNTAFTMIAGIALLYLGVILLSVGIEQTVGMNLNPNYQTNITATKTIVNGNISTIVLSGQDVGTGTTTNITQNFKSRELGILLFLLGFYIIMESALFLKREKENNEYERI